MFASKSSISLRLKRRLWVNSLANINFSDLQKITISFRCKSCLISKSFSLRLKSPKITPEHYPRIQLLKEKICTQQNDLLLLLGDLSHIERLYEINSLYICLQELWIISFSVVNKTEKLRCCQNDLGHFFSVIGKIYLKES